MARLTVKEIIHATGGRLLKGDGEGAATGVSIDSRTIKPGELFVCIKGQSLDGHDFANEALQKGAAGLLVSSQSASHSVETRGTAGNGIPAVVMVRDTAIALQKLAGRVRESSPIPLIAVTGSNGKTTTKELIVSILEQRYEVLKNQGNLNNLVGLPLSLLQARPDHNVAVLEMGMNSPGEIAGLCRIAKPNVGVITNISAAHLGGLGSLNNILNAKGELVDYLGSEDILILNMTDSLSSRLAARTRSKLITFGNGAGCTVRCKEIESKKPGRTSCILEMGCQNIPVELNIPGRYNAYNAAAAAAVGLTMKMEPVEIKAGLERFTGMPMRFEIIRIGEGIKIFNDCYNANPISMREALKTFAGLTRSRNSTIILGDMLELGESSRDMHYELGKQAASIHRGKLLAVGRYAHDVLEGAIEHGLEKEKTFAVSSAEDAAEMVPHLVGKGQWAMIKGSRGMHMEKVVERLKEVVGKD